MAKFIDITGNKYGKLTVLSRAENKGKKTMWNCLCDCGNTTIVESANLKALKISSCGCLKKELLAQKNKANAKHNMTGTPLYIVWDGIKKRASRGRRESKHSINYIDRGIDICEEWDSDFVKFYDWAISNGYKKGLQIDRIDNNKGYSPKNCRFVTSFTNNMNRRTNLDEKDISKAQELYSNGVSIAEIARILGLKYSGLYQRLTGRRGIEKTAKHFKSKDTE